VSARLALLVVLFAPAAARAGFVPVAGDGGIVVPTGDGGTFADLDDDGAVDFLTVSPEVFLGVGDGTFVAGPSCDPGGAPIVGDFDNDGHLDVLRIRDEPVLCKGDGRGGLEVVPNAIETSPFVGMHSFGGQIAYGGAAADLDGDGWLDLYMSNYEDEPTPENPNSFTPFADLFYANDGAGNLSIVAQAPEGLIFQNRGVTIGDYDDDVHPDVYSASYRLNRDLLWNNDAGNVAEVAEEVDAMGWGHTISAVFGDFDGDVDLDIFVCNFAHPGNPESFLYLNDVAQSGVFVEHAHGIAWQESYASAAAADYDADGDLDLFMTTVYPGDFGRLYQNDGSGTFVDVTAEEGLSGQEQGYGVSWADIDADGDLDLWLGGSQAQHLHRNEGDGHHYLFVEPRGDGVLVDTAAITTRVIVRTATRSILREVQAGGSGGDRGSSDHALHFGLGDEDGDVEIEVRWRTGVTCTYASSVDTVVRIAYAPDDPACAVGGSSGESGSTGDVDGSSSAASSEGAATTTFGSSVTSGADESSEGTGEHTDPRGCGCGQGRSRTRITPLVVLLAVGRRRRAARAPAT
jgi:hypothetical protein